MMNEKQKSDENMVSFQQIEQNFGLTRQLYEAKFVYCQQQNPGQDAYLVSINQPLQSQTAGFTLQDIRIIHALGAQMIYEAGKALRIPISTTILAQSLFHFFYVRNTYIQYDIRDAAIGAVYLACKSEQTLKKGYQIVLIFDYIFKAFQGQKQIKFMEIDGIQYNYMKKQKLVEAQLKILFDLGFQIYRLKDLPHRHLGALLALFDRHPKYKIISKQAWKILNDIYLTTVCVYYSPQVIAAAAVFIAFRQTENSFGTVPWWILMEARVQNIQRIHIELQTLKELSSKINIRYVSERISKVAENYHNLVNVFPVFYYRKIWLDRNGKLCKQLNDNKRVEKGTNFEIHTDKKEAHQEKIQSQEIQQQSDIKKKNKKKKNKHKSDKDRHKKKKDRKKKYKSRNHEKSLSSQSQSEKDKKNLEDFNEQEIGTNKLQVQGCNQIEKYTEVNKDPQQNNNAVNEKKATLNLSKKSLLSSINQQLVKHKQRVQQREEKIAVQIAEVFEKAEQKSQHKQSQQNVNDSEDSDDEEMRLIQELKKKVKKNRENQKLKEDQ